MKGVDDLAVSVKGSWVRGHPFGAIVDQDRIRGGMNGERFSHEVIRHGIAVGIEDHQGGLGGFDRRMDRDMVPGIFGKGPEFLLRKKLRRFFPCGPVDGLVFVVGPFVERLIEGR